MEPPHAKWFLGGKLNASVNWLDRHVRAGRGTAWASGEGIGAAGTARSPRATTTLADPAVVAKLRDQYESQET
jgi:hypothetical protein